jgi:hypothetical protein
MVPSDFGTPMVNVLLLSVPWALAWRKYKTANVSVTELPLMVPINGALLTESVSAGALPPTLLSVIVPCR